MDNEKPIGKPAGLALAVAEFASGQVDELNARITELEAELAAAKASASPIVFAVAKIATPDQPVAEMKYPTTYADLARITPKTLFNRWVGSRSPAGISAFEAFEAARTIPHAITYSIEAPAATSTDAAPPASFSLDEIAKLIGAAHYLRDLPHGEAKYQSRVVAEIGQRLLAQAKGPEQAQPE